MGIAGGFPAERTERRRQIEKLSSSSVLHGFESLREILRYLAEQEELHPGELIGERQIAVDVFHRPADFDPQLDSSIRVQAARLRSKLEEYYAGEGSRDIVIVDLPKGSYKLTYRTRATALPRPVLIEPVDPVPVQLRASPRRRDIWLAFLVIAAAIGVVIIAALGYLLVQESQSREIQK